MKWINMMMPDGVQFDLLLTGVPEGQLAVYPTSIPSDAPRYRLAWSVADYIEDRLGTATTTVSATRMRYLPLVILLLVHIIGGMVVLPYLRPKV